MHVVTTQTEFLDALMDDNRYDTVVSVVPFVSLLLVNGNAFAKPGDQSATFVQLSLDPISRTVVDQEESVIGRPIRLESVEIPELAEMESVNDYDVVVLSEVPQLPDEIAEQLSQYVNDGGGLWVIPDRQASTSFYNEWKIEGSESTLLPAALMDYQLADAQDEDVNARIGIDLQAIASGFASDLIETGEHDLTEVLVSGYRKVALAESAVASMKLTSGDPLFAEHTIGEGRVLLQSVTLTRRDCNLPQRVCFPVLMHLWSYHLADCQRDDFNFGPAPELSVPVEMVAAAETGVDALTLVDPAGEERSVKVVRHSHSDLAQISPAGMPGVYSLSADASQGVSQSFTVARDGRESDLAVVSKEKLDALQAAHDIQWLADPEQLQIARVGEQSEQEISPYLLLTVLGLIAAESLLAAWIRRRRMVSASPQRRATGGRGWTEPAKEAPGFRSSLAPTPATQSTSALSQPVDAPATVLSGGAE